MKFRSNRTGYSLIEVLVAVGILGFLGLAVGSLSTLQTRNSQKIKSIIDGDQLGTLFQQMLAGERACTTAFGREKICLDAACNYQSNVKVSKIRPGYDETGLLPTNGAYRISAPMATQTEYSVGQMLGAKLKINKLSVTLEKDPTKWRALKNRTNEPIPGKGIPARYVYIPAVLNYQFDQLGDGGATGQLTPESMIQFWVKTYETNLATRFDDPLTVAGVGTQAEIVTCATNLKGISDAEFSLNCPTGTTMVNRNGVFSCQAQTVNAERCDVGQVLVLEGADYVCRHLYCPPGFFADGTYTQAMLNPATTVVEPDTGLTKKAGDVLCKKPICESQSMVCTDEYVRVTNGHNQYCLQNGAYFLGSKDCPTPVVEVALWANGNFFGAWCKQNLDTGDSASFGGPNNSFLTVRVKNTDTQAVEVYMKLSGMAGENPRFKACGAGTDECTRTLAPGVTEDLAIYSLCSGPAGQLSTTVLQGQVNFVGSDKKVATLSVSGALIAIGASSWAGAKGYTDSGSTVAAGGWIFCLCRGDFIEYATLAGETGYLAKNYSFMNSGGACRRPLACPQCAMPAGSPANLGGGCE